MKRDIRFIGEAYQGAEEGLGEFESTLESIVDDHAFSVYGKNALPATDIEIAPAVLDTPFFAIGAWHQTGGSNQPARLHYHDLIIKLSLAKEDMFAVTDDKHEYRLTTRAALLLISMGNIAIVNSLLSGSEEDDEDD